MINIHTQALVVLIALCSTFSAMGAGADDKEADKPAFLRVTTQPLSELLFRSKYSAPASIVSLNDSDISAEIQARAISINAIVGEQVSKGQLLVELDCRSYQNTKQQAEAALKLSQVSRDLARKQFSRNTRLFQRGALPRENFDLSESELFSSNADVALKQTSIDSANIALSKCKIHAPFNGQVTVKHVQQGQIVSPGTPLIRVLETDSLEVEAELSPTELERAKASQKLLFNAQQASHEVTIRTVIKQLDGTSNTQAVRLNIDKDTTIIAGLNGRLEWQDTQQKILPEYLVRRGDKLGVMTEVKSKAKFHEILDAVEGQPAAVDLPSSTRIIVVNRYSAQDGQPVAID
ncbi:efflux RND transporter periplasmic adaptor subunit [Leucothrix sargassi]|nr:efflux RND transporter periplasmic adaptor subunit [Leucothrix sargassi]